MSQSDIFLYSNSVILISLIIHKTCNLYRRFNSGKFKWKSIFQYKTVMLSVHLCFVAAPSGDRTHTLNWATDFKSAPYTNSDTIAWCWAADIFTWMSSYHLKSLIYSFIPTRDRTAQLNCFYFICCTISLYPRSVFITKANLSNHISIIWYFPRPYRWLCLTFLRRIVIKILRQS